MRKLIVLFCFSMLLSITASAFDSGGGGKLERFALSESDQAQIVATTPQSVFTPTMSLRSENFILAYETCNLTIALHNPNTMWNRDVGWRVNKTETLNLRRATRKFDNSPYRNFLRIYRWA